MSLVETVRGQVRAGGLLAPPTPIMAMLSGGRDSVCLLDLAVALRGSQSVSALHVNYGLREQADEEEGHCRDLCGGLSVQLTVVRAERPPGASGNLHAWARELRYGAAGELADDHGALIAAGHTASDQVETILYRLAASPGRRALLGMVPREGRLVRPLLGLTREQTAAYCAERGLAWREDESNDLPQYARARVRNRLLPAFEQIHPAARSNLLRTVELLREETELLDALVEAELKGARSIALERLGELPSALARMVVVRLAEDVAGARVPQAGGRVAEILALGARGGSGELHVGGLAGAVVRDGVLSMRRIESRMRR